MNNNIRLFRIGVTLAALMGMSAAEAVVQTHTSPVQKLLTGRGRYNIDYGGIQVVATNAISGSTCASAYTPAELARTFYYSSGLSAMGGATRQSFENIVNSAAAQGLPVTIEYDTAGCTAGYGINIISISISPPAE